MLELLQSFFADPLVSTAGIAFLGAAVYKLLDVLGAWVKAFILKSPSKTDDEFLEAIEGMINNLKKSIAAKAKK